MNKIIEAVYVNGVFRPLKPVDDIKEHEKVRLVITPAHLVAKQRANRLQIDPKLAEEIADSPRFDLFD